MWWGDTGLPWVIPSPNMPTVYTAAVYPGMCLVEGTNLSEGRGTTHPFEFFGAPWLEPFKLAARLNASAAGRPLPSAYFLADVPEARGKGLRRRGDARDAIAPSSSRIARACGA